MKIQVQRLLSAIIVFMVAVGAYATEVDGISYELNSENKTASVIKNYERSYSGEIVIPSQIEVDGVTYSVTSIGDHAFQSCRDLTSVTLPNSVTSIGFRAFEGCYGLTSINIPNSVTSIGCDAFMSCDGLTSITLPNSVTSIEAGTFSYCHGLTSITLPNSVTSIGNDAFHSSGLIFFTVPNSVTSIGSGAFAGCLDLISVTIPSSVTSIGESAFYTCSSLKSITIPSSVTSIEKSTFDGCSRLKSFTIPSSVTSIGESAFNNCSGLTSITIPNSVTSIGGYAFAGCKGLNSVSIPNSVTSIEYYTFEGCSSLTSITIPNSVTSIGQSAFSACSGLTSITIPNSVTDIGDVAFAGCPFTSISIPNSVTSIGGYAFAECIGLTSITIPNSVMLLGDYLFNGCTGLNSIYMESPTPPFFRYYDDLGNLDSSCIIYVPVGAREAYVAEEPWNKYTIEEYTDKEGKTFTVDKLTYKVTGKGEVSFNACEESATGEIEIPATVNYEGTDYSVASITDGAFAGCEGLTSVTIPATVTSIGNGVFAGCSGLTAINVAAENKAFASADGVLMNKEKTEIVTYPAGRAGDYEIPSPVATIGREAFAGCTGLTAVTIPATVTDIEARAFANCEDLTAITMDADVPPTTAADALEGVPSSCVIRVPAGSREAYAAAPWNKFAIEENKPEFTVDKLTYKVTGKDEVSFNACEESATGEIEIPATVNYEGTDYTVASITDGAFAGCEGLTSVTIPATVTSIGYGAFSGCENLTSINMDAENEAFASADGVLMNKEKTEIVTYPAGRASDYKIPATVATIGREAFAGCTGLTAVTIPATVTDIEARAFADCEGLTAITMDADVPPTTAADALEGIPSSCVIRIPIGSRKAYAAAAPWNKFTIEENKPEFTVADQTYEVTGKDEVSFNACEESATGEIEIPATVNYEGTDYSVTSITDGAFAGCEGLTSVTIPATVTSIGNGVFAGCSKLTAINVKAGNEAFASVDGVLMNKEKTEIVIYPAGRAGSYEIPSTVTTIGREAFAGCTGLTAVTIPATVTDIEARAFANCEGLTAITMDADVPPTTAADALEGVPSSCVIRVPIGSREAYAAAAPWNKFTIEENKPEFTVADQTYEVTGKDEVSFNACEESATGEIEIPATVNYEGTDYSVTSITDGAFAGCEGLTSVTIPATVTSIGYGAFSGCENLTSINMDAENEAFASVDGVLMNKEKTEIVIYPAGRAGSYEIPSTVTTIGREAFAGCTGLTAVTIPATVTDIEARAFANCEGLTAITMDADVPPTTAADALEGIPSSCVIRIPIGSRKAYAAAAPWNKFTIEEYGSETGIGRTPNTGLSIVGYYDMEGRRLGAPVKGTCIVRYSDGTTRKVIIK